MCNNSSLDLDFSGFYTHEYDLCLRTYGMHYYKYVYYPFLPGEDIDEELDYSVSILSLKTTLPYYYYTLDIEKQFQEIETDDGYSSFRIFFHEPSYYHNTTSDFIKFIQKLGYNLIENEMKDDLIYLTFKAKYKQPEQNNYE